MEIFWTILWSALYIYIYIYSIRYCYKVAEKLEWNKNKAIAIGVLFPFGGALIYNHYSRRGKKGSNPSGVSILLVFAIFLASLLIIGLLS